MKRVLEEHIPTSDGDSIAARVLIPEGPIDSVVMYVHGGGWVIGALDEFDTLGRRMAKCMGAAVVLIDYRLAPEHRYPTAAYDTWDALKWVDAHMERLIGARRPLIVAGDSAGGNLAAVVALRSRDEGGPEIACQVLVYPVTHADFERDSYTDPENQLMLSRESMIWFWDHYAPDPERREEPMASPLLASDLSGLPPTVLITAEHDVLRDEGEAYAERLRREGVPVKFKRFERQMHGFFTILNVLPASADALEFVAKHATRYVLPQQPAAQ